MGCRRWQDVAATGISFDRTIKFEAARETPSSSISQIADSVLAQAKDRNK